MKVISDCQATLFHGLFIFQKLWIVELSGKVTNIGNRTSVLENDVDGIETEINKIHDVIEHDESILIDKINASLELTIQTNGYYNLSGQFVSDTGREYAIINNVAAGEKYLLSTYVGTTAIAGALFIDNSESVVSYDLRGTGTGQYITDALITIPTGCTKLIIQSAYNVGVTFTLKK